ncbi:tetratricopeptide repeat protein [Puniceibacterium sediminis]|uniref:Flp pilus assembly protein TadD, contains TPR repeats n=1 Tax=Puniceibacterium sediminis TaxID=1608407 RepID=A0A238VKH4_9RHOB|nr:tetratricopeptide repeat protein [Puniceibacterium sediminis]SNR34607.1 Flp pilus assembly protein TadD, contains TPR repeats [Puniceibacterium sediminis]
MSNRAYHILQGAVLAIALGFPAAGSANSLAGGYLAARQATYSGDYKAAADYYGKAILFDPANGEMLERAVLSNISLGDFERAVAFADRMSEQGLASQIAYMAQMAGYAKAEDYTDIIKQVSDNKGVGPLVDGLARAWAELGQGDMSAALVQFDEVAKSDGLGAFAAYHKALALASVGDFEGAEAIFASNAAGGMQMTRRAVMARAEILSQLERNNDAVTLIEDAFGPDIDPGLEEMRGKLAAGETLPFSHVRSARDGLAEVFYTLAGALSNEQNDDFTLMYVRVAEYVRPDHIDALMLSAELLEKLGQYDLAVQAFKKVPRDIPTYYAAELGRANALRQSGKVDAAVEVLEQLAETHGHLAVVQSTLGDVMRLLERYDEAVTSYTAAIDTFDSPDQAQWFLYYARGIANERLSNWDASESDFRKALELNPEQPQVLNYLGYSLVEKKEKLDEALAMIERAVAAQPDQGYIVDSLGWALFRLGRYEDSVGHMEHAAELMAVDPVVNDHLGDVYWAVGRKLEARFQWRRALSFVDFEQMTEEADPVRIRRKLEVGLDQLLSEEGSPPLSAVTETDGN